jgi:glycosyltransferase involved in cell wall biosynthesis
VRAASSQVRVLHVNDAAFTAHRILERAALDGQPWSFFPRAVADPDWSGLGGRVRFAARGAAWVARLAIAASRVDLLHIHSGAMLKHTRFVPKQFVLHLHGTDIRTLQYAPAWRRPILRGVRKARAVVYSTPDLADHILPLRPDAVYLPVPVTLAALPEPAAVPERRIFFCSRWEEVKGLEDALAIARALVRSVPAGYEVTGLDWGPGAAAARAAGVRLVPRMAHAEYLDYIAHSSAVVGQSAGMIGSSELEALGIGVPVYVPLKPGLYPDAPPVGGGAEAFQHPEAVADALLADLTAGASDREAGPAWIARTHETELAYRRLVSLYQALV